MFGEILFNLFIQPLELIFEAIYYLLGSYPGLAIITISIVMNFLALPLYKKADDIQSEERDKVQSMSKWVEHIKKTFKGDERYMMLTEYYRSQNYKQIYSLRSTFPLLLQVPFFIAAYHYLSNLAYLNGASFLFLKDLGQPDKLIQIGTFSINLMPIVMTLINVVSAYIYLRGFPIRDKIQTYGIAAIFLILLYNSPSGLVFYWTCNQIFSVLKNVFNKLIKSKKVKGFIFAIVGWTIFVVGMIMCVILGKTIMWVLITTAVMIVCQIPLTLVLVPKREKEVKPIKPVIFILGGVLCAIITGAMIPLSVIESSPADFVGGSASPYEMVLTSLCVAIGFFVIWLGIYYYMSNVKVRNIFTYAIWIITGVVLVDFFFFSKELGVMNQYLQFDNAPEYSISEILINGAVLVVVAALFAIVLKLWKKFVPYVYLVLIIGAVALSVVSLTNVVNGVKTAEENIANGSTDDGERIIKLSKNGKNVVVIMLDRAMGAYVPYIFDEKPELLETYSGFTYYSNTLSYAPVTNIASPALFGGYEYTPTNMNARSDELLVDKHNEAISVLPVLFNNNDYQVTVCDPPYANYQEPGDLSIYDDYENISAYNLIGNYSDEATEEIADYMAKSQKRTFFVYSLFRVVPVCLKSFVYNNGNYLSTLDDANNATSCDTAFMRSYGVLCSLSTLTDITDEGSCFLMMANETSHFPSILQTPEYEPTLTVTSDPYGNLSRFNLDGKSIVMETEYQMAHYHANMAAFLKIADWLEYLKENDVYDNTRIILVSDHSFPVGHFPDLPVEDLFPLLMVKDFDSTEFTTSDEFMTNADVATLATKDVIENPVNPFTGNQITNTDKNQEQIVTDASNFDVSENNGNVFDTSNGNWWGVTNGDVHDASNWRLIE